MHTATPVQDVHSFAWLASHASNCHSQFGEDGILRALFDAIGTANKWCFECGAADGVTLSNTITLVQNGWTGIFVERNRKAFREMERRHTMSPGAKRSGIDKRSIRVNAEIAVVGEWCPEEIIRRAGGPMDIDLLSLDIDGGEEDFIRFFVDLRPRVMCVEYRHQTAVHLDGVLEAIGESDYIPVAQTFTNIICVRSELAEQVRKHQ